MKIKEIKQGSWYETKVGVGLCLSVGGTRPPSTEFHIVRPIPRGKLHLNPRDVIQEIQRPQTEKEV